MTNLAPRGFLCFCSMGYFLARICFTSSLIASSISGCWNTASSTEFLVFLLMKLPSCQTRLTPARTRERAPNDMKKSPEKVYAIFCYSENDGFSTYMESYGAMREAEAMREIASGLNELEPDESPWYYCVREIDVWPLPTLAHSSLQNWVQLELPMEMGYRPSSWPREADPAAS